MGAFNFLVFGLAFLALASYGVVATDPTQLQDFCIGTNDRTMHVCIYFLGITATKINF